VTSPLFLIAHSVRGEAAFDVAVQMECPHCAGAGEIWGLSSNKQFHCFDCDEQGFWWIIPTSGHRAFPYWQWPLNGLYKKFGEEYDSLGEPPSVPPGWPDHFKSLPAPTLNIMSLFKSHHEAKPHIPRRL